LRRRLHAAMVGRRAALFKMNPATVDGTGKQQDTPQQQEQEKLHALRDSHLRSILKAVSWRVVGTVDTMLIAYFWTGQVGKALVIGATEVLTKIGLYYLHERLWARIPLGTVRRHIPFSTDNSGAETPLRDSNWRSLLKALSWRVVGTVDTIVVSYLWTKSAGKALVIGGTDVLTKVGLYYLHERLWARIPLGTIRRVFESDSKAELSPK